MNNRVDLRLCFEAFDRGDPHMIAAVGILYSQILDECPHLLDKEGEFFQSWIWGGKRDLLTGLKVRDNRFIYPSD